MNFELKKYYNLVDDNITNKDLIHEHLNKNLECIKFLNDHINELTKEENIFPEWNWEFAKKISALTIGTCILVFKINKNPMFIIESENFMNKKSFVTFDVFVFFLEIFLDKIKLFNYFDINELQTEVLNYKNNLDKEYKLNMTALLRTNIDSEMFVTTAQDKIIKYKF